MRRSLINSYFDSRNKHPLRVLLGAFLLVLLLSGCNAAPEPSLRIGTNNWLGYEPLYLAQKLGYYEKSQIKLIDLTSASQVIHALRNGNLEAAALTLDEALTLLDDGFNLKLILVMDISRGADALLAKPDIQSLQDLRGKRVGVEYTAVGTILLDGALEAAGLKAKDIEIINCSPDNHAVCYHAADAIVTFEPTKTKLLNAGARLLFDSNQIPDRIMDVLVVRKESINTHRHSLETLLSGYFKALDYLEAEPDTAKKLMSTRMGLTPSQLTASFKDLHIPDERENQTLLGSAAEDKTRPVQETAKDLARFMLQKGFLKNPINLDDFANPHLLPDEARQ